MPKHALANSPVVSPEVPIERRSVVIVSATSLAGRRQLKHLYAFLDLAGVVVAKRMLAPLYGRVVVRTAEQATLPGIVSALVAGGRAVDVVDLVLLVHGSPNGVLVLRDPTTGKGTDTTADDLADQLTQRSGLGSQLRLCYTTACYGASAAPALARAGFRSVIGAKAVNANSATEFPTLLSLWAHGHQLGDALRRADDAATRAATDFIARRFAKFDDVDSTKVLAGDRTLTISGH